MGLNVYPGELVAIFGTLIQTKKLSKKNIKYTYESKGLGGIDALYTVGGTLNWGPQSIA